MLIICIIDVEEERVVAVIDITNDFIQIKIDNKKDMEIIKIHGILVEMILYIAPDIYGPYVTTDRKGIK